MLSAMERGPKSEVLTLTRFVLKYQQLSEPARQELSILFSGLMFHRNGDF